MTLDANRSDLTLAVVGTGAMGRGIAQIAAASGCTVLLHDSRDGAAAEARDHIARMLVKLADKGKISAEQAAAATRRVQVTTSLDQLAVCHVAVEAIVEDLTVKQGLMRTLEDIVAADCVIATNTSSLSVTAIAAACRRPERVAGFHFFNPVPLMKVVEVIDGVLTDAAVGDFLVALARRMGHTPVRAKDTPGFVVNHAGRGYLTESLKMLGEEIGDVVALDRLLKGAAGFRMGPFELLDLTALDVSHPVLESIYNQFYQEPRFRPSPITRQRLAAGLLGRKSGRGFYVYDGDKQVAPPPPPVPAAWPGPVWVGDCQPLRQLLGALGARLDDGVEPGPESLCLVAPLGGDCTETALALGLEPRRTVAVDILCGLNSHRTVMTNPATAAAYRDGAHGLLATDGKPVTVIADSVGLAAQRVVATIVNIGCDIAQQGIASPEDIDKAVTLGLGYPFGPLAWGDRLGPDNVLYVLENMLALTGDPRYRPSPWLRRRARLGLSLLTPEG